MKKKSKWVRIRDAVFGFFVSIFKKILDFLKRDKIIRQIFKVAGENIILYIKELENNSNLSGTQKRNLVRKKIENELKSAGIKAEKYIINLVIEMALNYIRRGIK